MAKGSSKLHVSEGTILHQPLMAASAAEPPLDGMMAEERRTQILKILRSAGRVKVNELAGRFSTSAVTIRNDLNELHQRGLVLRSHGGAVLPDTILRESPVHERLKAQSDEKRRIGAMAATLIHNGETADHHQRDQHRRRTAGRARLAGFHRRRHRAWRIGVDQRAFR